MRSLLPSFRAFGVGGLVLAVGLVSALGCSTGRQYAPKSFPVEGALRYKDGSDASDLGGGTLELESSSKSVIKVPIVADGTFTRDEKLPAGTYRARVVPPPLDPDAEYALDARFLSFDSSGLTVTVGDEKEQRISLTLTRTVRPNRQ